MKKVLPTSLLETNIRSDLSFGHGEGAYLFGSDGRRYLDFFSGIAVTCLGHAHPHLVETIRSYAEKVWHITNNYRIPEQERLAERLIAHSFADRAFFCNSGLEAAEAAIKLARRTHFVEGAPHRVKIVTLESAFHGRSLAALAATNNKKYLEGFGPVVQGFVQVPCGDVEVLRRQVGKETAAVMVEPLQGEGGVRPLSRDYLREVRRLCDETRTLLVVDEVQCGMGRTGRLFAYEWAEITPDIMMLAKGLAGGFPVGAVLTTERVAASMTPGAHGSTFGGNPMAMAMANAVLDALLEPGFLEKVVQVGDFLWSELRKLHGRHPSLFVDVRGAGLLVGLKCTRPAVEYVDALRDDGMLAHTAGDNVLRLMPPLIITNEHVVEAIQHLERVCQSMSRSVDAA
jgi:acetylornithine/N-succinyldiaminopimelate aminotransferase